jgi:hypothetical protein
MLQPLSDLILRRPALQAEVFHVASEETAMRFAKRLQWEARRSARW